MGGPQAWQAVETLLGGLQKTKKGKAKRMRKGQSRLQTDGTMASTSAEENANNRPSRSIFSRSTGALHSHAE